MLVHRQVPWAELLRYPLIAGHPVACEGFYRQLLQLLRSLDNEPTLVEQATSLDMMLTLVAAGYGLGLMMEAQTVVNRHPGVAVRSIMDASPPTLTTYVLRPVNKDSEQLDRFIARLG
ncbi:transcriptional regulator [Achromobacter denitrificans]|nr:transcriptional regulator [Achromobacter denitrificans]